MEKATAKVFVTGRSQAVRIPRQYRFSTDEVYIERMANGSFSVLNQSHELSNNAHALPPANLFSSQLTPMEAGKVSSRYIIATVSHTSIVR